MARRDERQKASDIHREANYVFAQKGRFEEAFPEIADVAVEVNESAGLITDPGTTRVYRKGDIGEYVDCSNSLCYGGGVSIGDVLREMVRNNQTELETSKICRRYEGSAKGRRKYRDCLRWFRIKATIQYTEQHQSKPPQ